MPRPFSLPPRREPSQYGGCKGSATSPWTNEEADTVLDLRRKVELVERQRRNPSGGQEADQHEKETGLWGARRYESDTTRPPPANPATKVETLMPRAVGPPWPMLPLPVLPPPCRAAGVRIGSPVRAPLMVRVIMSKGFDICHLVQAVQALTTMRRRLRRCPALRGFWVADQVEHQRRARRGGLPGRVIWIKPRPWYLEPSPGWTLPRSTRPSYLTCCGVGPNSSLDRHESTGLCNPARCARKAGSAPTGVAMWNQPTAAVTHGAQLGGYGDGGLGRQLKCPGVHEAPG